MTNQQAINLLKGLEQSLDDYCELNDEGKAAFCMAVTALELFGNSEQLPSAQPEQRWIPCSERLPEEYGVYRITWTTSALKKRFVCDAAYESTYEWDAKRDKFKGKWLLDDFIAAYYPNIKVIAWKPIEEPYAERREE